MNEFQAIGLLATLFALRCIIPLLITIGLCYLMNRMVDRWRAEDEAALAASARRAMIRPGLERAAAQDQRPCWLLKQCDSVRRDNCPAYQQSDLPCWLARLRAEGQLPATCPGCPIYLQRAAARPLS